MDDEITAAFEGLTPEHLIKQSSYTGEQSYPVGAITSGQTAGRKQFRRWVDTALEALRISTAQGHHIVAFTMLHSLDKRRYFQPDADETAPMYANRLHREAKQMNATWIFNAMVAPGAHFEGEAPEPIDPDNFEAVQAALESGRLNMSVCWYAEMREGERVLTRSGVIPVTPDGVLMAGIEGDLDPRLNPFAEVLSDAE